MWYETVNYRLYWYRRCNRWSNKFPWSEYQTSSLFRSPLYFFQIPTVLVLFRSPLYLFFSYPQCCIHCCAPSNFYRILSNCYRILSNCYRILSNCYRFLSNCYWILSNCYRILSNLIELLSNLTAILLHATNMSLISLQIAVRAVSLILWVIIGSFSILLRPR